MAGWSGPQRGPAPDQPEQLHIGPALPLKVAAVNCGRSGLFGTAVACADYCDDVGADVLVVSEAHLRAGTEVAMPGYVVLMQTRTGVATTSVRNLGGVAIAVRRSSAMVESAHVMECCLLADVMCVKLHVRGSMRPLYVVAVYLPPTGAQFECECNLPHCSKSHVACGLEYIHSLCVRYGGSGDFVVMGDFNANWQAEHDQRRRLIIAHLLHQSAALAVHHPRDANGVFIPTRTSANGTQAVLDLCLLSPTLQPAANVTVTQQAVVADHCAVTAELLLMSDVPQAAPSYPVNMTLPPPSVCRMFRMPAVMLTQAAQLMLQGTLAQRMPRLRASVFMAPERAVVEISDTVQRVVAEVQVQCGLTRTVRGVPAPALRHVTQLQRRKERLTRQLRMLRMMAPLTRADAHREELYEAALSELDSQWRHARQLDRQQERVWQQQVQEASTDQLLAAWVKGDMRLWSGALQEVSRGRLEYRRNGRQHAHADTARISQDVREWHDFLRAKYEPPFLTAEAATMGYAELREQLSAQAAQAPCDVPVTVEEVRYAVHRMRGQSAAIGEPVAVWKMLAGTDVLHMVTAAFSHIFDTGHVNELLCIVRAVVLYKKGDRRDKSNYRVIGVGTALSRVFQLVVLRRLLQYSTSEMAVSANQHGFVFGRSTEQCIFTAMGTIACCSVDGKPATGVFLDLAGAFASTPHAVIMCRLRQLGVPRYLWRAVNVWLAQQRMFVQIGRQASPLFPVNIGVVEGGPASPLQFILVLNTLIQTLDGFSLSSTFGIRSGCASLLQKWFADDGMICGHAMRTVQPLLDVCGTVTPRLGMVFNVGIAKTAAVRFLPTSKQRRRAVRQSLLREPEVLYIGGQLVPYHPSYKYLGVWTHGDGHRASVREHVQHMRPVCATIVRQATTSTLRSVMLFTGLATYLSHWKPRLTYALGYYAATVGLEVQRVEEVVLKVLCGAPNMPICVLRSILGIPSFHCILQQQQLGLLWRVLLSPPGDMQRLVLAEMVRLCGLKDAPTLWWYRVWDTLVDLDMAVARGGADARGVVGGPALWTAAVADLARRPLEDVSDAVARLQRHWKRVLLVVESQRRALEVQRCEASLADVQELLLTPSFAPFIVEKRSKACQLRVLLRGGVRTLFPVRFLHVAVCPWCECEGGFTVSHLLRDCEVLEAERMQCWQQALAFGVQSGVMAAGDVAEERHSWYLLMVGAAVPHAFCHLHLDAETHWARKDGTSATGHLRRRYDVYTTLLRKTGAFLVSVVAKTLQRLEDVGDSLRQREPTARRRTTPLRWTPEQRRRLRLDQQQDMQE